MDTVCHVITKLELGGAQEVALYAVSHLNQTRFRPVLVAGAGGMLTEEAGRLPGVQTIIVPSLGRRIHGIHDLLAFIELVVLFRRLHPAVVHTHSSKAGVLGRWAAWLARVPIIIHTVHGFGITPAQPAWLQRMFVLLERVTGWITTHWIAVATVDVEKGRRWRLFRDNVSVIRPGIDPRPFQVPLHAAVRDQLRAEFGASAHHYLIGTVACFKLQKAPEDVIKVAKRVCDSAPQARFVLIGDGELRPRIEALIRQHRLQGRVHLAGWRRDIDKAIQAFDVLLLTSHWEGLPRVILEASAAGVPVVATKVGGVEEVLTHGRHARLYDAGDVDGLATGLRELLEECLSGAGKHVEIRKELPEEFRIEEMVKQYQTLYDRLLLDLRTGRSQPNSLGAASHP
ncbi:MAG TPA: glycosyltransferase [Nitrospira sp.]